MACFSSDDPEASNKMRNMFGPGQVDQMVRGAIQSCWMMLPEDAKNVDELERQFRRLVERAIRDLREDIDAFGLSK
jgi:phosphate uptake regulator